MVREASGEDATKKKPVDSEKDALKSRKQMEDSRQVLIQYCTYVTCTSRFMWLRLDQQLQNL